MATITNKSQQALTVGNVALAPGDSTSVEDFAKAGDREVLQAWADAGLVSINHDAPRSVPATAGRGKAVE